MTPGTCIHYTGLQFVGGAYRSGCCRAGVNYYEKFNGKRDGIMLRMPCIQFRTLPTHGNGTYIRPGEETIRKEIDRRGETMIPCALYQEPTPEQVEEDRRETEKMFRNTMTAVEVSCTWRASPKPESDRREVIECPVCHGRLHLFQSAQNGHVHGNCETEGCVSWME